MNARALGCLLVLFGAGAGCVAYAPARPPPPPVAAARPPPPGPHRESECGPPIRGLREMAQPAAMLLFVDLPGTEQIPDFISDAACQVAEAGRLVFVALDIPEQEQSR